MKHKKHEMQMITVDPEFQALIPPLAKDELTQLEANLVADGCREPLVVWAEGFDLVLLDGHNRYAICNRLSIPFRTVIADGIVSRDDAIVWIVDNQLGRRNLTDFVKTELALVKKPIVEARAREREHAGANQYSSPSPNSDEGSVRTDVEIAKAAGVGKDTVRKVEKIKENAAPELLAAVRSGELSINTAADIATLPAEKQAAVVEKGKGAALETAKEIRIQKAEARRAELAELRRTVPPLPDGKYEAIVIDPPWAMEKVERDARPNQVAFDYPTMDESELAAFGVPGMAAEDCHLFCWTTHKHLPVALRLLDAWGFRYVLTMVWHKAGGFQPFGLPQYNCEFVLYGRKGAPEFVDTKAFSACFEAPRREHSRKPDEFYDVIRRVTAGPRVDVFSREPREGFAQFGNEAGKFAA